MILSIGGRTVALARRFAEGITVIVPFNHDRCDQGHFNYCNDEITIRGEQSLYFIWKAPTTIYEDFKANSRFAVTSPTVLTAVLTTIKELSEYGFLDWLVVGGIVIEFNKPVYIAAEARNATYHIQNFWKQSMEASRKISLPNDLDLLERLKKKGLTLKN